MARYCHICKGVGWTYTQDTSDKETCFYCYNEPSPQVDDDSYEDWVDVECDVCKGIGWYQTIGYDNSIDTPICDKCDGVGELL
jgi:DnaJ-class molecular chaperone